MKFVKKLACHILFVIAYSVLLTLVLATTSIFAVHGKHYRIIAEQLTLTPGTRGGIKPLPASAVSAGPKHFQTTLDNPAKARVFISSTTGLPHRDSELYGEHNILITNRSSITQRFEYKQTLSCKGRILENIRWVEIEPDGMFEDQTLTYLVMHDREIGVYPAKATVEIKGLYNTYRDAHGTVTIR